MATLKTGAFVIYLLAALLPARLHATAIVAVRTPGDIFIGADTQAVRADGKVFKVCKIFQTGKHYYAAAGFLATKNFNLMDIVAKAFNETRPLSENVESFDKLFKRPLENALEHIRKQDPSMFKRWLESENKACYAIIFAGIENHVPTIFLRDYAIEKIDPIAVGTYPKRCPGDCDSKTKKQNTYLIGEDLAMIKYNNDNLSTLWNDGIPAGIFKLLKVAAAASSTYLGEPLVAEPFDIIQIKGDGSGAVLGVKGACEGK